MKKLVILIALIVAGLAICVRAANNEPARKGKTMTARGTFNVKVTPQPPDDSAGGPFGRLFLDKQFQGDLNATSKGQMMAAETAVKGSAAYVALELVSGVLNGKRGTFILQHKGTMRNGAYVMDVTVVPDSGTGELLGLAGAMKIIIEAGKHSYEFEYSLEEK